MDRSARTEGGGFFVSEPGAHVAASVDPAIRPDGASLDRVDWTRRCRIRYPLYAAHKSFADLPANEESSGVQLLLGHTKLESTVRYLDIEVDDALEMAEQTEV